MNSILERFLPPVFIVAAVCQFNRVHDLAGYYPESDKVNVTQADY